MFSPSRILIYAGDGIGIDTIREATKVLETINRLMNLNLHFEEVDWGMRYYQRTGTVCPADFIEQIKSRCDAVFLGALGDPSKLPDYITLKPLIDMRQRLDQYICHRPAKLLPGLSSPLVNVKNGIDIIVVRENSEGEYSYAGGRLKPGQKDEVALEVAVHTRKGVERVIRYAFELARTRPKRLVTMATKSNALKNAMVMWDEIGKMVAQDYPDIKFEKRHIDALTQDVVINPGRFDVIVASNLFGDILSDLCGGIAGSLGMAPSANINPERKFPSMFEPVHGSAPDIMGLGIANPLGAIRAAAMMLDFLGRKQAAEVIDKAVVDNLLNGPRTKDIGGNNTTTQVGDDVVARLTKFI